MPSLAGGVLFLLGGVIVTTTLRPLPTVGAIQGLAPALRGEANPTVSPGAAEVRFIDHHAFGLIAGNLLQAVAIFFLVAILLFLLGAVRFRRPETSSVARPLVLSGGAVMVLVSIAHPVAQVLNAHNFVDGHDFTAEAVNHALTQSTVLEASEYLGLAAGLALAAGMVVVTLGATRTGLLARWMMYLGIFAALLAFTPFGLALGEVQQLIPAFWMVSLGILLMGAGRAAILRRGPPAKRGHGPRRAKLALSRAGGPASRAGARGGGRSSVGGTNGTGDMAPEPDAARSQRERPAAAQARRARGSRGPEDITRACPPTLGHSIVYTDGGWGCYKKIGAR